uniref:Uncharacterized protein n=1 Tax=Plectus sambesii TaxID=2011161 RepID=A0A914V8S5_9BILA
MIAVRSAVFHYSDGYGEMAELRPMLSPMNGERMPLRHQQLYQQQLHHHAQPDDYDPVNFKYYQVWAVIRQVHCVIYLFPRYLARAVGALAPQHGAEERSGVVLVIWAKRQLPRLWADGGSVRAKWKVFHGHAHSVANGQRYSPGLSAPMFATLFKGKGKRVRDTAAAQYMPLDPSFVHWTIEWPRVSRSVQYARLTQIDKDGEKRNGRDQRTQRVTTRRRRRRRGVKSPLLFCLVSTDEKLGYGRRASMGAQ